MQENYYDESPFYEDEERRGNENKRFTFDEKRYLNTKLNDGEAERQITIRILPITPDTTKIHIPVKLHPLKVSKEIAQSGFKSFQCLNDTNARKSDPRGCPFCNRYNELMAEAKKYPKGDERNDTFYNQAKIYRPKTYYIVRVIERGHEDEGVKFWRFAEHFDGSGILDKLKSLYSQRQKEEAEDEDGNPNYNIFDIHEGRDLIITIKGDTNTKKTSYNIVDKGKKTPVSKNEEQMMEWVNDPTDWRDMYAVRTYDYLEVVLNGGIPTYSKADGKYVDRDELERRQEEADSYDGTDPYAENNASTVEDDSAELPF